MEHGAPGTRVFDMGRSEFSEASSRPGNEMCMCGWYVGSTQIQRSRSTFTSRWTLANPPALSAPLAYSFPPPSG